MKERSWAGLRALPREVWALGAVSFLTDMASDMVYPLLPELLGTIGSGAVALGVMEGVAELVSSVVKVWAGRASDRSARRGPFVVMGYGLAAIARPCMAFVTAPWQVVAARTADRIGKGIRAAPRDAIIAAVTPPERRGLAFGVHQAMDNFGAVIGPLIAWGLLSLAHVRLRIVFALAVIPGLASTSLAIATVRREGERVAAPAASAQENKAIAATKSGALPAAPVRLLIAITLFSLGASADSFLMARLFDLGLSIGWIPIAWVSLQLCKSLFNVPGGALADRLGPRRVLFTSWLVYALAYAAFARATTWGAFWALLPFYAVFYGLSEGTEKAFMVRVTPKEHRGTALGAQHAVHGVAMLPANVVFGVLYASAPGLAFSVSAGCALAGAVMLLVLTRDGEAATT